MSLSITVIVTNYCCVCDAGTADMGIAIFVVVMQAGTLLICKKATYFPRLRKHCDMWQAPQNWQTWRDIHTINYPTRENREIIFNNSCCIIIMLP